MEPADLADLLRTAFVSLPAVVSVTPRVVDDGVELDVEFRDADGRFEQSISSRLDLASAESGRLAAYARAVAARAQELGAGDSEALWALLTPSSILLQSVLDDRSLQTEADFLALLQDPDRLDRAARREQVRRMLPGRQDLDDRLAAALYDLQQPGRGDLADRLARREALLRLVDPAGLGEFRWIALGRGAAACAQTPRFLTEPAG
jgi:hypothetical protein